MTVQYDPQVLETLEPEEREALTSSEYSDDELAAMEEVAGDDNDDGEGDEASAQAAESTPETQEAEPAPATAPEEAVGFRPQYKANVPADFAAMAAAVQSDFAALTDQLANGDIDIAEFHTKSADLQARRDDLTAVRTKAEVAAEMGAQTAEQEWTWNINRFFGQALKTEGIDYRTDTAKQRDLDVFVKALAHDDATIGKPMDWFLQEAHRMVKVKNGIVDAPAKTETPATPVKPSRKPPLSSVPQTLAQVPGSDGPGDLSGEFADIDRLEGDKLEDAIAKMSPAQRERYLQAA